MSGSIFVILIFLLTVTQRRSANEVWASMARTDKKTKTESTDESEKDTSEIARLITPAQLEGGAEKSSEQQARHPEAQRAPKPSTSNTVRFASIMKHISTRGPKRDGFEAVNFDLGLASNDRLSMSEQQAKELWLV